jgi:hypothetical protein
MSALFTSFVGMCVMSCFAWIEANRSEVGSRPMTRYDFRAAMPKVRDVPSAIGGTWFGLKHRFPVEIFWRFGMSIDPFNLFPATLLVIQRRALEALNESGKTLAIAHGNELSKDLCW